MERKELTRKIEETVESLRDELVALAPTLADVEERSKVYDELQDICYEEMAIIPICYQVNVNIHNVAIENYAGRTFGVGLPTIEWAD